MSRVEGLRDIEIGDLIKFAPCDVTEGQRVFWRRVRGFAENNCPLVKASFMVYRAVNWDEIIEVIKPGWPDEDLIFGGAESMH